MIEVYFLILQNAVVDNHIIYTLLSEPVLMTIKECIHMANEVNNNPDVPQVAMCMPQIIKEGLPV